MNPFELKIPLSDLQGEGETFVFETGGFYEGKFGDMVDQIDSVYVKDGYLIIKGTKEK